jgi:hypothetical protein
MVHQYFVRVSGKAVTMSKRCGLPLQIRCDQNHREEWKNKLEREERFLVGGHG